mmetsp:Transcript_99934/g.223129  ORF Transcript_99934/g.223129 Transcript_99934/m.223129 type:complete len:222 (+) Transcript_99934:2299-2964(+)
MPRVRVVSPPPHDFEQEPHAAQSPNTQSTGQDPTAQGLESSSLVSHALPLLRGARSTLRVLFFVPAPQVDEHAAQSPQEVRIQSTGQPWVLQSVLSLVLPSHGSPPNAASVAMLRVRVLKPVPHVFVQPPHTPQLPHTQFTGQWFVLQDSLTCALPVVAFPPCAASIAFPRCLMRVPPPHVRVQEPHAPQSSHAQSTGQGTGLQDWLFSVSPVHACPPCAA